MNGDILMGSVLIGAAIRIGWDGMGVILRGFGYVFWRAFKVRGGA